MKFAIKESTYKQDVEMLGLSNRAWNALKRNHINTIEDVLDRQNELPTLNGLGENSIKEIKNKIFEMQLESTVDKLYGNA